MVRRIQRVVGALLLLMPACDDGPIAGAVTFVTDDGMVEVGRLRLADTPEERSRGLMGVTELGSDDGMLFAFGSASDTTFWMKDTPIPLDIAFWGEDGIVDSIVAMAPCPEEPCPRYEADAPFVFALEMRAGWFERNGVEVGDRADARLLTS